MRCDVIRDANPDNRFCGCVRNIAPENKNCQRAKKFPLSGMYKIKAIEQKILSAKLKDFNKIRQLKTRKNGIKKRLKSCFSFRYNVLLHFLKHVGLVHGYRYRSEI